MAGGGKLAGDHRLHPTFWLQAIMNTKYSAAKTRNVCQTPGPDGDWKCRISMAASGAPIMAPPPKPMMAMPVAMPRRSGNHFTSVETGEM